MAGWIRDDKGGKEIKKPTLDSQSSGFSDDGNDQETPPDECLDSLSVSVFQVRTRTFFTGMEMINKTNDIETLVYRKSSLHDAITYSQKLTRPQKSIFHALSDLISKYGDVRARRYIAVDDMCFLTGYHHTAARRILKNLSVCGYIIIEPQFDEANPKVQLPNFYQITEKVFAEYREVLSAWQEKETEKKAKQSQLSQCEVTPPLRKTHTPPYAECEYPSTQNARQVPDLRSDQSKEYVSSVRAAAPLTSHRERARAIPEEDKGFCLDTYEKTRDERREAREAQKQAEEKKPAPQNDPREESLKAAGQLLKAYARGRMEGDVEKFRCSGTEKVIAETLAEKSGFDPAFLTKWKDDWAELKGKRFFRLDLAEWVKLFECYQAEVKASQKPPQEPEKAREQPLPSQATPKASEGISETSGDQRIEIGTRLILEAPAEPEIKEKLIRCVEKGMALTIVQDLVSALRRGSGRLMVKQWCRHFKIDSLPNAG